MGAKLILFYAFMSLSFICATCGVIENNETSDSGKDNVHYKFSILKIINLYITLSYNNHYVT